MLAFRFAASLERKEIEGEESQSVITSSSQYPHDCLETHDPHLGTIS